MGAAVTAPAAGLMEMEVPMCLGAALVYLAGVGTGLPWVLGEVAASVERPIRVVKQVRSSDGSAE